MALTVYNPRGKKKHAKRRAKTRRRSTTHRRRRARARVAVTINRRRRRSTNRRRHHTRRRRHTINPRMLGGATANLMKGAGVGVGIYGANLLVNFANNTFLKDKPLTGLAETGAKAVAGLIVLPMALKFLPLPGNIKSALVNGALLGAGAIVALDLLEQYATPQLPAEVQPHPAAAATKQGYSLTGYGSTSVATQPALSGMGNMHASIYAGGPH